jgi:hypothetical protein
MGNFYSRLLRIGHGEPRHGLGRSSSYIDHCSVWKAYLAEVRTDQCIPDAGFLSGFPIESGVKSYSRFGSHVTSGAPKPSNRTCRRTTCVVGDERHVVPKTNNLANLNSGEHRASIAVHHDNCLGYSGSLQLKLQNVRRDDVTFERDPNSS